MPALHIPAIPLRRALIEPAPLPKATAVDALSLARKWFLKGRRLDLQSLASQLGVNRVTLYRWVGTHDMLLGEILCSLAELAWEEAIVATPRAGSNYAAHVLHGFMTRINGHAPFQNFVKAEGEYSLKLLTSKHSRVQECVIHLVRALLEGEAKVGRLELPGDLDSLAYALIRICEAFLYNDLITGHAPDIEKAAEIINALLHSPWKSLQTTTPGAVKPPPLVRASRP